MTIYYKDHTPNLCHNFVLPEWSPIQHNLSRIAMWQLLGHFLKRPLTHVFGLYSCSFLLSAG